MTTDLNKAVLDRIAEAADELNRRIMDEAMLAVVGCSNIGEVEQVMPGALADVFMLVAKTWRDEAAERVKALEAGESGTRGAKGAQTKADYAASLLAGIAVSLRAHNPLVAEPLTVSGSAAQAAAEGALAVAQQLDTPASARRCGVIGTFNWGRAECSKPFGHGDDVLHYSAETLAEWASSEPVKGLDVLRCDVEHTFMPEERCVLLLDHEGDHYREGVGTWSSELRDAGGMDGVGSPPFPGDPGYCEPCDLGGHTCKGCGEPTSHEAPADCPDVRCPGSPLYRGPRTCAPEECGGSSLDPCRDSIAFGNERHDGDLARPGLDEQCRGYEHNEQTDVERWCLLVAFHKGDHSDGESGWKPLPIDPACACDGKCQYCVMKGCEARHDGCAGRSALRPVPAPEIPEIFPNQCRSQLGVERCMMPVAHTGTHIGTRGGKWLDAESDLVAPMRIASDPAPLADELPPPSGPQRIISVTPAGERFLGEMLVKGATAAAGAIGDVVGDIARALTGSAVAVLDAPPIVAAGEAFGAPPIVSAAWTPPVLDIRRMTWAELASPPANVDELRPKHRSISQLTTYEDCSLKYRLQRYRETISVPTWALVGGSAIHKVIEQGEGSSPKWLYRVEDMWREIFRETIEAFEASSGVGREHWLAANRGKENLEWWEVEGLAMLMNYLTWRKGMLAKGWGLVAIELEVRTPETETQRERLGYVDQVWWNHATGAMLLPDLKSGSRDPKDVIQLDTYGRQVAAVGAGVVKPEMIKSVEAGYLMLRKGELVLRGDVFKRTQAAEIDFRFANMDRAERAGIYTPNVGAFCGSCTVRAACPVGRPEAS